MRRFPLCLVILLVAACDRANGSGNVPVRDSAGIVIIENPAIPPPAEWTLSEPLVSIGGMAAEAEYELYNATHGLRLDDGRIVIANRGSR